MPAEPTIDYDTLMQDAMRGVVRTVLTQAAKSGLPGDHHFYVSFDTGASGVVLSKRLKDKYPHEMTIVLQHRFWDLAVGEDGFEVKLTFDGIPERLVVPFGAIRVFFDPSVRYGLQFEDPDAEPEGGESGETRPRFGARSAPERGNGARPATLRSTAPKKPRVPRKGKAEKADKSDKSERGADKSAQPAAAREGVTPMPASAAPPKLSIAPKPGASEDRPRQDNGGAQILSLDAFRKK
jgi:hypothetical protein